ncbi:MAG: LacI family DNA-binding transcriptional regulator [Pseudomonadales bacterium]|nr:LacI family DNA-binding transcriptional regulator [Pseudomonadales bacterium]
MTTLKDVAKYVGVSVATVSYVLTGRGSVSGEMSERVLAAVEELGYRPNRKAQAMRTGISNSIGIILPDLTKPFFPLLAQQVENKARQAGYAVLLVDCQNKTEAEEEGFELLSQQGVDGVIWFPINNTLPKSFERLLCPVVLIDRSLPGCDTVHCDYSHGGQLQAEYVIKMKHKKVGLLSGPKTVESARKRRRGFVNAAKGKFDIVWELDIPFSSQLPEAAINALKRQEASMIVCADDLMAIGTMGALNDLKIKVPDQVSVIGFDNISWSTVVTPKLTTINQPISEIGAEAINLLQHRIANTRKRKEASRTIILDVDLVERASTMEMSSYAAKKLVKKKQKKKQKRNKA